MVSGDAVIGAGAIVGGAVIAAGVGFAASWTSHHWSMQERSAERKDVRRMALLAQRTTDLRELADLLTSMMRRRKRSSGSEQQPTGQ